MRTLLLLLLCPALALSQSLFDPGAVSALSVVEEAGSTVSYLIKQDFEGTGYDNSETWSESGSPDPDYTPALVGSQSLECTDHLDYTESPSFSGGSETWFYGVFDPQAVPSTSAYSLVIKNSGGTQIAALQFRSTDGSFRLYHGTATPGTITGYTSPPYYFWIRYIPSSGSDDGVAELYLSTTETRGAAASTIANGTSTDSAAILRLQGAPGAAIVYDKIRVDDAEIGNSPE